ncbi:MAG: FtsQ-type POTRA domain-containing protein [Acidimicrobiales bacterium]|nr:FtsQ-type POTRA domain-containing protein [Acidimicrobiales bacterium]
MTPQGPSADVKGRTRRWLRLTDRPDESRRTDRGDRAHGGSGTGARQRAAGNGRGSGTRSRIDPRMSARRTAVIREQGRRRLLAVVIGLAGTAGLVGIWALLQTPLFSARSITVLGNVHETPAQVAAQAGLADHPPLLDVDAGAASTRIEQLPWVRSATVRVSWPDGVHITITEETPRFVASGPGGGWDLLSADGRVLGPSASRPPGLVLLTVPRAPGAAGSHLSSVDGAGLEVATTLPPSFAAQVTGVTVEAAGWVQLSMTTPILVDLGSATELPAKYEDVSSILAAASLHNGDVIDVSIPKAPTVTPG